MKIKKRRKSTRYRGSQTAKRGAKERTRGSGNQGGKGWAGTGKRADQKKTKVINLTGGNNYFGKDKALRRGKIPEKLKEINLEELKDLESRFEKEGEYLMLTGYKILGEGGLDKPLKIKANSFSKSAKEKIEKAGGEAVEIKK